MTISSPDLKSRVVEISRQPVEVRLNVTPVSGLGECLARTKAAEKARIRPEGSLIANPLIITNDQRR